jgi:hypothetical protein
MTASAPFSDLPADGVGRLSQVDFCRPRLTRSVMPIRMISRLSRGIQVGSVSVFLALFSEVLVKEAGDLLERLLALRCRGVAIILRM